MVLGNHPQHFDRHACVNTPDHEATFVPPDKWPLGFGYVGCQVLKTIYRNTSLPHYRGLCNNPEAIGSGKR